LAVGGSRSGFGVRGSGFGVRGSRDPAGTGRDDVAAMPDDRVVNVIVFGASGMVGQAVLREVLADPRIDRVLVIGRTPLPDRPDRVREIVHGDFYDFSALAGDMTGYDACFFCLGVSANGMKEQEYRRITYDITLAAATVLAEVDPTMAFLYVSGMGTDSSERGRLMWARVKGATENALLSLPFRAYGIRPGFILPAHGVRTKTRLYAVAYQVTGWMYPVLKRIAPGYVMTSEELGRAMIVVAADRPDQRVLATKDLKALLGAA
jgi:uncharacterized protein YbjT (DUF2867 family)